MADIVAADRMSHRHRILVELVYMPGLCLKAKYTGLSKLDIESACRCQWTI